MIGIWKHFHKIRHKETQAEMDLRQKYSEFIAILQENERCLDEMTRLEERFYNQHLLSFPFLKKSIGNMSRGIGHAVESVIRLSNGRNEILRTVYRQLDKKIQEQFAEGETLIERPIAIPLDSVRKELADKVGTKMANLGEMQSRCGLRVPAGFATTACAYAHFIEFNKLSEKIQPLLDRLDTNSTRELIEAEKEIRKLFLAAEMPPDLERAIVAECAKHRPGGIPCQSWAVRSSAIGEDLAASSFAGQFASLLNVQTDQLVQAYKEVAASKYTARVMVYQRLRNIRDDEIVMSVGFIEMIDPVCSGTMYTINPTNTPGREMLINAVWGVGELLVDGVVSADAYVLSREQGFALLRQETADKEITLTRAEGGGLQQMVTRKEQSDLPCLTTSQLKQLAAIGVRIEEHFQGPQDIEWCIDRQDRVFVLQARPLRVSVKKERRGSAPLVEARLIADQGQPISHGVGWGKVLKAITLDDIPDIVPHETVLVLKHSSPRFVSALQKVAAVVIEKGNWTDHMASVIREFGVPCLVRVPDIFEKLGEGQMVTIDADAGNIYEGQVTELREKALTLRERHARSHTLPGGPAVHDTAAGQKVNNHGTNTLLTESHQLLAKMADFIFPLHLTDPRQRDFAAESCRTWHDILRFCHETALNEMFQLKDHNRLSTVKNIFRVATDLPFTLYLMDILGDVVGHGHRTIIAADEVKSLPFQRLWEGMTDPAVNWKGVVHAVHASDIFSAMLRTPVLADMPVDTRSYAVVAKEYLNLSLSMGYHYIVLDCYLSDDAFNNYITLSFKGGAAEMRKRSLRVMFVAQLLKHMDFTVTTSSDFLQARLKAETAQELGERLTVIGRILGVSRLLDLAIEDMAMVESCVASFLDGDYSLGC